MVTVSAIENLQKLIEEILTMGIRAGQIVNEKDFDKNELANHLYYCGDDQPIYIISNALSKENILIEYPESDEIGQLILILQKIQ